MCMGVWAACVYVYHVLAWCLEVRVLATLELELQSVCGVTRVLGTESRSFARAITKMFLTLSRHSSLRAEISNA